ncbi:MAG: CxxxxCH/CxxCH domain-containing protein, partial [Polyangiaceae bacterium]
MSERRQRLLLLGSLSGALLFGLMPSCLERHEERAIDSDVTRCASCHGDPTRSGDYLQRSAPPINLIGATDIAYPSVGAHQFHVYGSETHGPVACNECHIVPEQVSDPGHADSAEPAEIHFGSLASQDGHDPTWSSKTRRCSDSYCHGARSPSWTQPKPSDQACGTCHGLPPAPPHPQSERCSACHTGIDAENHFPEARLHVNGQVEYLLGKCNACHGNADSPAPPVDTHGNTDPTSPGVGAHRVHLAGGNASRPVECQECHQVPSTSDLTHPNGQAELVFSGVSQASADAPSYDSAAQSCTVYCHAPSAS